MAGGSDKKIAKNNAATLASHGYPALIGALLHIALVHFYYGVDNTWIQVCSYGTVICTLIAYYFMYKAHVAGGDLNMAGGISEYIKDIVLVGTAVLFLSCVTLWAYVLWALVFLYVSYVVYKKFLSPMMFSDGPAVKTEAEKKREQKRLRQAEQQQKRSKGK
eukprot:m.95128 g.95128  ORF g.95128 m.95128 type:complete len:162 (-) comp26787_c1_seq1:139-624(-)